MLILFFPTLLLDLTQVTNRLPSHSISTPGKSSATESLVLMERGRFRFVNAPERPRLLDDLQSHREIDLPKSFAGTHWVFVGGVSKDATSMPHLIWALADAAGRGDGSVRKDNLLCVHSADAGLTWQLLPPFPKPASAATFDSLRMTDAGAGELRVRLEYDIVRRAEDAPRNFKRAMVDPQVRVPVEHGVYVYTTRDGGRSWSEPQHEPNDLQVVVVTIP
jgi:hypothetical protein